MSFKEKLDRLKELNKIAFPSNEELKERLTLLDDLDQIVNSNEAKTQNNEYAHGQGISQIDASLQDKPIATDPLSGYDSKEIFKQVLEENKQNDKPKKVYRGIISGRIEKWRDERREHNKATPEMIEQLKLELQKTRLEAQIAVMKKIKKENKGGIVNFHLPKKIFVDDIPESKTSKKKGKTAYQKIEDDLRASLGTNEKDFSQVITGNKGKDFRI